MPFFFGAWEYSLNSNNDGAVMAYTVSGESTLPPIKFRLGTLADLDQLLSLYGQLIPEQAPARLSARTCLARIISDPAHGWIAVGERDGAVVATCQAVVYQNVIRAPQPKAMIDSVVVDEGLRGLGIGKGLMSWAMQELHDRNCGLVLVATSFKRVVAHKLYEELGFSEFGHSYLIDLAAASVADRQRA